MRTKRSSILKSYLVVSGTSALVGVVVGIVIFLYKWGAEKIVSLSQMLYEAVADKLYFLPLFFLALIILAVIGVKIVKHIPNASGGGIPTAEGILRGIVTFRWLRSFLGMVISSYVSFFAGLPLGNEGPSVLIGTSLGKGTNNLFKNQGGFSRYAMTGGSATAFAVATGAPLSGIVFVLEEVHRRFSPTLALSALVAVMFGASTNEVLCYIFNRSSALFHVSCSAVEIQYIYLAVIVGIVAGLVAVVFSKLYIALYNILGRINISNNIKFIFVFLFAGSMALLFGQNHGSGHSLVDGVLVNEYSLGIIFSLLAIRTITVLVVGGAGVTGGLFVPILAIGALIGGVVGKITIMLGASESVYAIVVVASIATLMSSVMRAPMTSIVFAIEALGANTNVLFVVVAVAVAYFVGGLLKDKPLYDEILLQKLAKMNKQNFTSPIEFDITVQEKSFIVGKSARDILWPPTCFVLQIKSKNNAMDSESTDGESEREILQGDVLKIRVHNYDRISTFELLEEIVGKQPTGTLKEIESKLK